MNKDFVGSKLGIQIQQLRPQAPGVVETCDRLLQSSELQSLRKIGEVAARYAVIYTARLKLIKAQAIALEGTRTQQPRLLETAYRLLREAAVELLPIDMPAVDQHVKQKCQIALAVLEYLQGNRKQAESSLLLIESEPWIAYGKSLLARMMIENGEIRLGIKELLDATRSNFPTALLRQEALDIAAWSRRYRGVSEIYCINVLSLLV